MVGSRKHLTLLFHSLKSSTETESPFNPELFSSIEQIEELIQGLKKEGYKFDLFRNIKRESEPTCSITFDDGYFNNHLFLPLAEKHKIPFVIFVSAYNIHNSEFFLWDLMSSDNVENWDWKNSSYLKLYEPVRPKTLLNDKWRDLYRPFTFEELTNLGKNPWVFLGNHTYSHKPLSSQYEDDLKLEMTACDKLFKDFPNYLMDEMALPCGLLSIKYKRLLEKKFARIYTSNGGLNSPDEIYVNRVSLVNPSIGGSFLSQIANSQQPLRTIKRSLQRFIYSNF